jgi:hypothetical protein
MKRKREQVSQQVIPDISFHLIFCFLTLKELIVIAQCNHEFRRLIKRQSFISMYSSQEIIHQYDENKLFLLFQSPFKDIVQNIVFRGNLFYYIICLISKFPRLQKAELIYSARKPIQIDHDFSLSPALPTSLKELSIEFHSFDTFQTFPLLIELIPNLINLELDIMFNCNIEDSDLLHIKKLKQLETLTINNCINNKRSNAKIFIDIIRLLPKLKELDINNIFSFHIDPLYGFANLQCLCVQPGAPPNLSKLKIVGYIPENQQLQCFQCLQQLPSLDEIEFSHIENRLIPSLFFPWTKYVPIHGRNIISDDMIILSQFNRLESIHLYFCTITEPLLTQLFSQIFKTIKKLYITGNFLSDFFISFLTISQCTELTHLHLTRCAGLFEVDFHLLNKCKKLEEIEIIDSRLCKENLPTAQREALQLPSTVFPFLKICTFEE